MKKHLVLITLAVFMPLFAAAQYGRQNVSIIAHAGGGWGGFPERASATRIDHFMGALGADAKFSFNDNWSLLVGLDYQFRFMNSGYTTYSGMKTAKVIRTRCFFIVKCYLMVLQFPFSS